MVRVWWVCMPTSKEIFDIMSTLLIILVHLRNVLNQNSGHISIISPLNTSQKKTKPNATVWQGDKIISTQCRLFFGALNRISWSHPVPPYWKKERRYNLHLMTLEPAVLADEDHELLSQTSNPNNTSYTNTDRKIVLPCLFLSIASVDSSSNENCSKTVYSMLI